MERNLKDNQSSISADNATVVSQTTSSSDQCYICNETKYKILSGLVDACDRVIIALCIGKVPVGLNSVCLKQCRNCKRLLGDVSQIKITISKIIIHTPQFVYGSHLLDDGTLGNKLKNVKLMIDDISISGLSALNKYLISWSVLTQHALDNAWILCPVLPNNSVNGIRM